MEFFLEIVLKSCISYPVAFARWAIFGFKKGKLKSYLEMDWDVSLLLFSGFLLLIVLLVRWISK